MESHDSNWYGRLLSPCAYSLLFIAAFLEVWVMCHLHPHPRGHLSCIDSQMPRAGRFSEMGGTESQFFFRVPRLRMTALCSNILSKPNLPHLYEYQIIEENNAPGMYTRCCYHTIPLPLTTISSEVLKGIVPFLANFKMFMYWIYTKGTLSLFKWMFMTPKKSICLLILSTTF